LYKILQKLSQDQRLEIRRQKDIFRRLQQNSTKMKLKGSTEFTNCRKVAARVEGQQEKSNG